MMDMNTQMRLTGLASGLDTEAIIQNLGRVNTIRVDAVRRDRQMALWRQEALRSTMSMIQNFQRSNLNVANPMSNFRSPSAFAKFNYTLAMNGIRTDEMKNSAAAKMSVIANGDLKNFNQTVQAVAQLATRDTWTGEDLGLRGVTSNGFDLENLVNQSTGQPVPAHFGVSIDGISRTVTISSAQISEILDNDLLDDEGRAEAFANAVNAEIERQFGSEYKNVVSASGKEISFEKTGSNITIYGVTGFGHVDNAIGFVGGASTNSLNNKSIGELFGGFFTGSDTSRSIMIGGKSISLNKSDTINTMVSKINNAGAGVTLSYSTAGGRFTLAARDEGTAGSIENYDAAAMSLFEALKLGKIEDGKFDVADRKEAQNLIAIINGEQFTRQSNSFQYEGMTYTFNTTFNDDIFERAADGSFDRDDNGRLKLKDGLSLSTLQDVIKIEVGKNTSEMVESIKSFIDEYNNMVDHINDLLSGKKDRSFRPLTDDEKKAMKEEDIKAYEDKAKLGMLANDADLRKLLDSMRSAIYQKVDGVGLTMSDIGITTGSWQDRGRLVVNEEKLQNALENRYDDVVALFTKNSSIPDTDMANRGKRMAESGIAQRLNDVFNDAVRTSAVGYGSKGYLIERAGMQNDGSVVDNVISRQVKQYDDRIQKLLERWYRQENAYYAMFARMETAMSKMQAQQNSLAQMMAQSGR
jgi:flagellar hook-associated protein 2